MSEFIPFTELKFTQCRRCGRTGCDDSALTAFRSKPDNNNRECANCGYRWRAIDQIEAIDKAMKEMK